MASDITRRLAVETLIRLDSDRPKREIVSTSVFQYMKELMQARSRLFQNTPLLHSAPAGDGRFEVWFD